MKKRPLAYVVINDVLYVLFLLVFLGLISYCIHLYKNDGYFIWIIAALVVLGFFGLTLLFYIQSWKDIRDKSHLYRYGKCANAKIISMKDGGDALIHILFETKDGYIFYNIVDIDDSRWIQLGDVFEVFYDEKLCVKKTENLQSHFKIAYEKNLKEYKDKRKHELYEGQGEKTDAIITGFTDILVRDIVIINLKDVEGHKFFCVINSKDKTKFNKGDALVVYYNPKSPNIFDVNEK